jgi:hypothetical protein
MGRRADELNPLTFLVGLPFVVLFTLVAPRLRHRKIAYLAFCWTVWVTMAAAIIFTATESLVITLLIVLQAAILGSLWVGFMLVRLLRDKSKPAGETLQGG